MKRIQVLIAAVFAVILAVAGHTAASAQTTSQEDLFSSKAQKGWICPNIAGYVTRSGIRFRLAPTDYGITVVYDDGDTSSQFDGSILTKHGGDCFSIADNDLGAIIAGSQQVCPNCKNVVVIYVWGDWFDPVPIR